MFNFRFLQIMFLFALVGLFGCPQNVMLHSFVKADKEMVPLLYHISAFEFEEAEKELALLERRWELNKDSEGVQAFLAEYPLTDVAYAEKAIPQLERALEVSDYDGSLILWESIRDVLAETRSNYGIDYFPDDLFNFRGDVEILHCIASDELLDLREWEELVWQMEYVADAWYFIRIQQPDSKTYGFDADVLNREFRAMDKRLAAARRAMHTAQRDIVAQEIGLLRQQVLRTICVFFEYHPVKEGIVAI